MPSLPTLSLPQINTSQPTLADYRAALTAWDQWYNTELKPFWETLKSSISSLNNSLEEVKKSQAIDDKAKKDLIAQLTKELAAETKAYDSLKRSVFIGYALDFGLSFAGGAAVGHSVK